jgi:hypothetical protein
VSKISSIADLSGRGLWLILVLVLIAAGSCAIEDYGRFGNERGVGIRG